MARLSRAAQILACTLLAQFEAAPVLCRGGTRFLLHTGSLPDPPPVPSRPSPACRDWGEKGRAGGVRCQSLIVAVYRAPPRHKTGAASNRRHDAKKVPWRRQYLAEREGFEPSVPDKGTHDFQSCTIGHSVTSPEKIENWGQE